MSSQEDVFGRWFTYVDNFKVIHRTIKLRMIRDLMNPVSRAKVATSPVLLQSVF